MSKRISTIIGYAVGAILVVYILVSTFLPEHSIDIFGFRTFVVISNSMEPDVLVNDMIIVTKPKSDELEPRDIITFRAYIPELDSYSYVTHYIGDIQEDTSGTTIYKTQGATKSEGDYDEWTDEYGNPTEITLVDIEGVYQFKIPKIGYLITMLRDPIFVALLVANGTILYFIVKLLKGHYKDKRIENKKES